MNTEYTDLYRYNHVIIQGWRHRCHCLLDPINGNSKAREKASCGSSRICQHLLYYSYHTTSSICPRYTQLFSLRCERTLVSPATSLEHLGTMSITAFLHLRHWWRVTNLSSDDRGFPGRRGEGRKAYGDSQKTQATVWRELEICL